MPKGMYDDADAPTPKRGGKRGGVGLVIDMGSLTEDRGGDEPPESERQPEEMPPEVYDALARALPDGTDEQIEALYEAIRLCKE